MKMKRRVNVLIMMAFIGILLMGCESKPSGERIDSGKFQAICPDGFLNIPQTNLYVEPDEDGNYPGDPTLLMFSYGAKDETDAIEKPSVTVSILEGTDIDSSISVLETFYNKTEKKTYTIGDNEYQGVYGEMEGFIEGDMYTFEVIYVEKDDALFQIAITNNTAVESDLSSEHDAIETIIESIALD